MKYKAEVLYRGIVQAEFYYNKLTHPNQVVRNTINKVKGKFSYFLVVVVNEIGESWKYSVMKKSDGKLYVRKIDKSSFVFTKDEVDMIFSGNMSIKW